MKEIVRGSHLVTFLHIAKLSDKRTGKEITTIENKLALVSVLIGEPELIDYVANDKLLPHNIILKLKKKGINISSNAEIESLQKRIKKLTRHLKGPAVFGASGGVSATLTIRSPLSQEEISSFSDVAANLSIDLKNEET